MTLLVFGGSGQIGGFFLRELHARACRVVAISRQARADGDGVQWRRGTLPDAVPALPADVRAIFCLGPLDHFSNWLAAADLSARPRIVAMSSMSAESKRDSPVAAERELAARLRRSEQAVLARCAQTGSACTLFRATLIYGGAGGSLEALAARARRWRVFLLPRGRGLRQPVHADDLAQAVLAAWVAPAGLGVIEAGGGERLAAEAMFARTQSALAPGTTALRLPGWLLRGQAMLTGRGRGAVARLDQDLLADNTKLVGLLGAPPRPFQPGAALREPG